LANLYENSSKAQPNSKLNLNFGKKINLIAFAEKEQKLLHNMIISIHEHVKKIK